MTHYPPRTIHDPGHSLSHSISLIPPYKVLVPSTQSQASPICFQSVHHILDRTSIGRSLQPFPSSTPPIVIYFPDHVEIVSNLTYRGKGVVLLFGYNDIARQLNIPRKNHGQRVFYGDCASDNNWWTPLDISWLRRRNSASSAGPRETALPGSFADFNCHSGTVEELVTRWR